jgi:hypothetical protein
MKAILGMAAALVALVAAMSAGPAPRAEAACSYGEIPQGWHALETALQYADVIVAGEVIREELLPFQQHIYDVDESMAQGYLTVRVDAYLKGSWPEQEIRVRNKRAACGDPGPRFQVGEYVLLSLNLVKTNTPPWYLGAQQLALTTFGSKIILTDGLALNDEPWNTPRLTPAGDSEALLRETGARLGTPPEVIDSVLAAQARSHGRDDNWRLVALLGATLVTVVAARAAFGRRRRRAVSRDL